MDKEKIKQIILDSIQEEIRTKAGISDAKYMEYMTEARNWGYEIRSAIAHWIDGQFKTKWYKTLVEYGEIPADLQAKIDSVYDEIDALCVYLNEKVGD